MCRSYLLSLLLLFAGIGLTKSKNSCVYQDFYQLRDFDLKERQLGEMYYFPGEGDYENYTVVISPNPVKDSYLDEICDWNDETSKLVGIVYDQKTTKCLHKWEQGSTDIVFRSVVSLSSTSPVYEFYMRTNSTGLIPNTIFKFIFAENPKIPEQNFIVTSSSGEYSSFLTSVGIGAKTPYLEITFEVAPGLSLAESDALSPRSIELVKWTAALFVFSLYFYTAIWNTSRHSIFGGKVYTFNAYMVVACVTHLFAMVDTVMFKFLSGYKPAFATMFALQVLLVVGLVYYIHPKSPTVVYQVLVPVYHVVAFINWSAGAYLVHPWFLPVSWIIYFALYWPSKSAKFGQILGNEWRLSVSTAVDFTSILLPFFLLRKGSMMYLQSHGLCAIYKTNQYMVIYSLLLISVLPLAFTRVRITQYKLNESSKRSKQALEDYSLDDLGNTADVQQDLKP